MREQYYSDEQLNSFVDGELDHEERVLLLEAAADSDELRRRICETQRLKEMVQTAYPAWTGTRTVRGSWPGETVLRYGAVASAGVLALYLLFAAVIPTGINEPVVADRLEPEAMEEQSNVEASRVVFHISSDDPVLSEQLLEQIELVLSDYAQRDRPIRVDVVANNEGLRLLQQGHSLYSRRIKKLHDTYPNLVFAACGNTIERFSRKFGEEIKILPEAVVSRSGVSFVARRQQTGWAYIKV